MMYILVALLFVCMFIYIKVARKFHITDKSDRSASGGAGAISGAGIIFFISISFAGIMYPVYALPVAGAALIGLVSFLDDCITLSGKVRILVHVLAVTLMLQFSPVFIIVPWWGILFLYLLMIGMIHTYSSTGEIAGLTSLCSLLVLGGLQYVNIEVFDFIEDDLIWLPMASCVVFLAFSMRGEENYFVGKTGKVTMAFWTLFLLLQLTVHSGNLLYLLFLGIYAIDVVLSGIQKPFFR